MRSEKSLPIVGVPSSHVISTPSLWCRKKSRPSSNVSPFGRTTARIASTNLGVPYGARPITFPSSPYFGKPSHCVTAV